jgi:hypothetical protein
MKREVSELRPQQGKLTQSGKILVTIERGVGKLDSFSRLFGAEMGKVSLVSLSVV